MVWQFVDVFKKVNLLAHVQEDDFSDRLNRRWTVSLLLLFCILVGSSQFVGVPISCWVPAQFTGAMTMYANHICWIADKYYIPAGSFMATTDRKEEFKYRINYYQWVPFILVFMALLFYFPYQMWRLLSKPSGLDAHSVMKIMSSMDPSSPDSRDKTMRNAVRLIDRAIMYRREYDMSFFGRLKRRISRCLLPEHRSGSYMSMLYIVIKVLYTFNAVFQFLILSNFMGQNFYSYGFDVIGNMVEGKEFWESPRFPRVTICNFTIRNLGENNHRYSIECTLPINLFNEKIFIFIWFWLCFVIIVSTYTLIWWLIAYSPSSRISFVKRYLKANNRLNKGESKIDTKALILEEFLIDYLKLDGVFLLRLVKANTNDIVVGELVCALWDNFKSFSKYSTQLNNNQAE